MKLTPIAIAMLAVAAGSVSQSAAAGGIERLAGASASSVNVAKALKNLCSGTYKLYKQSSSLSSLGNVFTATCSVNFTGTSTSEVQANVNGGSYGAVLAASAASADPLYAPVKYIDGGTAAAGSPTAACGAALGDGTGTLDFVKAANNATMYNCGTSTALLGPFGSDGGYMDVEGGIFAVIGNDVPANVNPATDFKPAPFYQAFGVGVSTTLYKVLQGYQVAKGSLPSTCATTSVSGGLTVYTGTGDATPLCQPTIGKSQISALIVAGNNNAKKYGTNLLIGGDLTKRNDLVASGKTVVGDPPIGTALKYCRRVVTSGTHATQMLTFLLNPTAGSDFQGALAMAGSNSAGSVNFNVPVTFTIQSNSGTGDVKTCLNGASDYALGVLSAENNPIGGSDTYRFVKLNGAWISEGVAGSGQVAEAIAGRYDYVFRSYHYCPGGVCTPILGAIDGILAPGDSTPGLFLPSESVYKRTGATYPVTSN